MSIIKMIESKQHQMKSNCMPFSNLQILITVSFKDNISQVTSFFLMQVCSYWTEKTDLFHHWSSAFECSTPNPKIMFFRFGITSRHRQVKLLSMQKVLH